MVVCKYDGRRIRVQRGLDDLAHGDARRIDVPALHENTVECLALRVEAEQIDLLLHRAVKKRHEILAALRRAGQDALRAGPADEMPPLDLRDERDQLRRALPDAGNLHQLGNRRFKHAGERAKALEQRVCQQICVLPRKCVIEQHLDHLHIRQGIHAGLAKLLPHTVPVAFVHGRHLLSSKSLRGCGCGMLYQSNRFRYCPV